MAQLVLPFHHNDLSGIEATLHDSRVLHFRSCLDETLLHDAVMFQHEYERAALFDDDGLGRHRHSVLPHVQKDFNVGELTRQEFTVRVRHLGAYRERP